jgi:Ser/Thr protein kinase RdoA (MazF antagonist)
VIDFDDALYHWYVMDIEQALDSLQHGCDLTEQEFCQKQTVFLEGYRSQFEIDDDQLATMPVCRRFANLFGYARIARAIQEEWENEPEWLAGLRAKLHTALRHKSANFGEPIRI